MSDWSEFVIAARGLCYAWWMGQMDQLPVDADRTATREFVEQFRDTARPPEPTDDFRVIAERLRERRSYRRIENAESVREIEGRSLRDIDLR